MFAGVWLISSIMLLGDYFTNDSERYTVLGHELLYSARSAGTRVHTPRRFFKKLRLGVHFCGWLYHSPSSMPQRDGGKKGPYKALKGLIQPLRASWPGEAWRGYRRPGEALYSRLTSCRCDRTSVTVDEAADTQTCCAA